MPFRIDDAPDAPDPDACVAIYHGDDLVDLLSPYAATIDLRILIRNLSIAHRYVGNIEWSVAAHTLLADGVARKLAYPPEARLAVLAHDLHEGIMGDIAAPVIKTIARLTTPPTNPVKILQDRLQHAVERRLCLPHPDAETLDLVKFADQGAYLLEVAEFWPQTLGDAATEMAGRLKDAWWTPMHLNADGTSPDGLCEHLRNLNSDDVTKLLRLRFHEIRPDHIPEPEATAATRRQYQTALQARETRAVEGMARTMITFFDARMAEINQPTPACD